MTFSIITVCKNAGSSLGVSLESLRAQVYTEYELILIDGASTDDDTIEALQRYKSFARHLISESDHGIYDAMNKGIRLAEGDYIYFLNAGDQFHSSLVLEKVAKACETFQPDLLFGDVEIINQDGSSLEIRSHKHIKTIKQLYYQTITHQALFSKRSLYTNIGYFDQKYSIRSDYDWLIKFFKTSGVKSFYLPLIISKYLVGGISARNLKKAQYEKALILKRNLFWRPYYFYYRIKKALHTLAMLKMS